MVCISKDNETKYLLLEVAKKEFLELGYQKASLRNICKKAGVTTGALYFFFMDKEDLFQNIVGPMAEAVKRLIIDHTTKEKIVYGNNETTDIMDDIEVGKKLIHFYYTNKQEAKLLLEKAQGSCYENFMDELVKIMQEESKKLIEKISSFQGTKSKFNDFTMHWFAHLQVESFLHVLSHDSSEEEALKQIEIVVTFLRGGYEKLLEAGQ